MTRQDRAFDPCRALGSRDADSRPLRFEIFVGSGFNGYELASVTQTLCLANEITANDRFQWRFVSHEPGLVTGGNGSLVRAEPAVDNHNLPDVMIVVGGSNCRAAGWHARMRQMQRKALAVVLLSDAATAYIRMSNTPSGPVTTHWSDAAQLREVGHYPNLSSALSESSDGVITAAGRGATVELVIGLIAPWLAPPHVAELSNQLLLPHIRKSDTEQPRDISGNPSLFDHRLTAAIKLMEASISEPLSISEITQLVGISSRHLERIFRTSFNQTPARFYKQLRAKRANAMIEQTLVPLFDVAIATGFGSTTALSLAIKEQYGITPSKMRARRRVDLLKFA